MSSINSRKATSIGGGLQKIPDCYVEIPNKGKISFNILPDITDAKAANFVGEPIMGRATPMKSFSHSEDRTFNITMHFMSTNRNDAQTNMKNLRLIQSIAYPRDAQNDMPYLPPPICKIKCGKLLADEAICAVMKSYSVKFPTDVAWDSENYMPVKFDVDTTWDVVYLSSNLPGQERIMTLGS